MWGWKPYANFYLELPMPTQATRRLTERNQKFKSRLVIHQRIRKGKKGGAISSDSKFRYRNWRKSQALVPEVIWPWIPSCEVIIANHCGKFAGNCDAESWQSLWIVGGRRGDARKEISLACWGSTAREKACWRRRFAVSSTVLLSW